jgi:hypothetical protein
MRLPIKRATFAAAALGLTAALLARMTTADEAISAAAPRPHVQRLAEYGLEPTTSSLATYLHSLVPTPERRAELTALVAQLGDDSFAQREQAGVLLQRQLGGATEVLQAALIGDNHEIRWRARKLLDQTDRESRGLLGAVLTTIREDKLSGLCGPLLNALPLCKDESLRSALQRALAATATPADAPLLRQQLASADPHVRILAIATLGQVLGETADAEAQILLIDPSELVQTAAARSLASHGRREALPHLVRLLEADDSAARVLASRVLRAATGQQLGYTAYDAPVPRAAAVARWKQWLAEHGQTATLAVPLRDLQADLGRLLVCDHTQNLLMEFDTSGRKLWQQAVGQQPWACQGLPSGHRLVGNYSDRTIVEYDATGQEVWRFDALPGGPTSVERLDNGNTLVACTEGGAVLEVDPAKKVVWTAKLEGRPVDARRLDDGRTLVTLQHGQKVVELDGAGQSVWEIAGVGMAFSAQRLESGNTLVCAIGLPQVREFDRRGNVVWAQGKFVNPYGAQRLASGNTVVVDTTGVTEIDPAGAVVNRIEMPNLSRMSRY